MHQMTVPIVDNTVDVVFSKAIAVASHPRCRWLQLSVYS